MNKVFNWTIGSFFRTIGRMLAFFITGIAIAYILAQSDLKIGNIFRYTLGVHAASFNNEWISSMQYNKNNGSWQNTNFTADLYHTFTDTNLGANNYYTKFGQRYDFGSQIKELRFNIKFRLNESTTGELYQPSQSMRCNIHSSTQHPNSGGTMADDVEFEYDYFTCSIPSQNPSLEIQDLHFSLSLQTWFNDNVGLRSPCYAVSNSGDTYSFSCPVGINHNINGLIIQLSTPFSYDFSVGVADLFSMEFDNSQSIIDAQHENTQAITNQTQQDQQQHEEIMDSNTTQAEDDAQDFFENFDAPDVGGLSAIITAPLSTIQSLLNATCSNLVLPLPYVNKNLTLPCMNDIYTQHFGAFFTLYQTIILGIIAYRCIRSIFFDLQGFADPSDDRIEVIDL